MYLIIYRYIKQVFKMFYIYIYIDNVNLELLIINTEKYSLGLQFIFCAIHPSIF